MTGEPPHSSKANPSPRSEKKSTTIRHVFKKETAAAATSRDGDARDSGVITSNDLLEFILYLLLFRHGATDTIADNEKPAEVSDRPVLDFSAY